MHHVPDQVVSSELAFSQGPTMSGKSRYEIRMRGLTPNMDENFIRTNFMMVGIKLLEVNVFGSYALVTVQDQHTLDWVVNNLKGHTIPLCPLKTFDVESTEPKVSYLIHVFNLSKQIDDYGLYSIFKERYPSVIKAVAVKDNYPHRRYGLVQFNNEDERNEALVELQGFSLKDKATPFSLSVPRNDIMPPGGYSEPLGSLKSQLPVFRPELKEEEKEDSDEEEIDPDPSVDYKQANQEFYSEGEQLFLELERTCWQPMLSVTSRLNSRKMKDALCTGPKLSNS